MASPIQSIFMIFPRRFLAAALSAFEGAIVSRNLLLTSDSAASYAAGGSGLLRLLIAAMPKVPHDCR